MKKQFLKLSVLSVTVIIFLVACMQSNGTTTNNKQSKADEETEVASSTEPRTVTGRVVNGQGKPIAHAHIRAQNDVFDSHSEVYTDANGYYKLPQLQFGGWVIYAWSDVEYHDHTYHLRMGMPSPDDYGSFQPSAGGAITKNFVWILKGNIPDREREENNPFGYWGGTIHFASLSTLNDNVEYLPAGAKVTVTLTPEDGATQFDGTLGEIITKSFTIEEGATNYYLYDIPQCTYAMSASINVNGVTHHVSLANDYHGPFKKSMSDVYFKPSGGPGSYENGLGVISPIANDMPIALKMDN